jgi:hypothetical protein
LTRMALKVSPVLLDFVESVDVVCTAIGVP